MTGLLALFGAAFLAATILPAQSELVFAAMQASGAYPVWQLLIVATAGNVLGAVLTYAMGLGIERFRDRRWFPANAAQMERAQGWFARWGTPCLLFSWLPGGDVLVLLAGVMRVRFPLFLVLTLLSKGGRYLVLAGLVAPFTG